MTGFSINDTLTADSLIEGIMNGLVLVFYVLAAVMVAVLIDLASKERTYEHCLQANLDYFDGKDESILRNIQSWLSRTHSNAVNIGFCAIVFLAFCFLASILQ